MTKEERKVYMIKYRSTPKYKAIQEARREESLKHSKEYSKNYRTTEKYKASLQLEKNQEAAKIAQKKYRTTEKFAKFINKYRSLETVKQTNRENNIHYLYGLNPKEHEDLKVKQNNLCAICNQPETRIYNGKVTSLCVDHNHSTLKIRGLLCNRCNTVIGKCNEDELLLSKIIEYLKFYKEEGMI